MAVERAIFTNERKVAYVEFLRVLISMKRPHMKYGKSTNKGIFKVCRKCGTATVKVMLRSMELVQSHKACFNHTYNVP